MSETINDIIPYNARVEPAIAHISPSVRMPVKTGAANTAWNILTSNSASSTNINFNISGLNPAFIIDREMRISTQITVDCTVVRPNGVEDGVEIPLAFGETDALRPFPFNQMINTTNLTIGSQTISLAQREVFDLILKTTPKKFLSRYNSTSPSYVDSSYKDYNKRPEGSLNDPLQGYEDAIISDMIPNGAFPINILAISQYDNNNNLVIPAPSIPNKWAANSKYAVVRLRFRTDEPLFISPLIFSGDMHQNKSGIIGINSLNVSFAMTGDPNHMFCTSTSMTDISGKLPKNYSNLQFSAIELHYKTYTPQITDVIPIKSVIPFKNVANYMSDSKTAAILPGLKGEISSPNINIGYIPDYYVICVRKRRANQTLNDASSSFYPINGINVSFNNNNNLLASCTMEDLWRLSVKNGSTQSFYEFRGIANVGTPAEVSSKITNTTSTVGSVVIISSTDLSLPSPITPGTMNNLLCNFRVRFTNNDEVEVNPEIVVMIVTDGIMTIMDSNVQLNTGLFYEAANSVVLSESPEEVSHSVTYFKRTGGNFSNRIASKLSNATGSGIRSAGGGIRSAGAVAKKSLFY